MATRNLSRPKTAESAPAPLNFPHDTEDRLNRVSMALRGAMQLLEGLPDNAETSTSPDSSLSRALSVLEIVDHEVVAIGATATIPGRAEVAHA